MPRIEVAGDICLSRPRLTQGCTADDDDDDDDNDISLRKLKIQIEIKNMYSNKFSRAESRVKVWRFSDASGTDSVPIFRALLVVISFGSTKPTAHPEDGDTVSAWSVRKPSHLDACSCLRKCHWILPPRKLEETYVLLVALQFRYHGNNLLPTWNKIRQIRRPKHGAAEQQIYFWPTNLCTLLVALLDNEKHGGNVLQNNNVSLHNKPTWWTLSGWITWQ